MRDDLASGKLSKLQLKVLKDPDCIVNFNVANFEDKAREERRMLKLGKKPGEWESDND
jgi:hypothetical protein